MSSKIWIGIDNGITGSIGIIVEGGNITYVKTPTKKAQNYTKKEQQITRVDSVKLFSIFKPYIGQDVQVLMERPFVNHKFFYATQSALRSLEATLICLELANFKYEITDSVQWQNDLLPEYWGGKLVEKEVLKEASLGVGKELFPAVDYKGFKDADGLLIAEFCKRKYPQENNNG